MNNGDLRVGFQDVIVHPGRLFDLEYFINPIPDARVFGFRVPGNC